MIEKTITLTGGKEVALWTMDQWKPYLVPGMEIREGHRVVFVVEDRENKWEGDKIVERLDHVRVYMRYQLDGKERMGVYSVEGFANGVMNNSFIYFEDHKLLVSCDSF